MRIPYSYRDLVMRSAGAVETTSLISDEQMKTPSHLRKILLVGSAAAVGFLAVVGFVASRANQACQVTGFLGTPSEDSVRRHEEMLRQVAALGIDRSPDAWVLFYEFAKRFSLIETGNKQGHPRDIQSIAKAGGGERGDLMFVLLTLFRWNGVDAEWVEVYSGPEAARDHDRAKVVRDFVHVPSLDQLFDPALLPAAQPKGSGGALLNGKSRIHYQGMISTTYQCPEPRGGERPIPMK